MTKPVPTPPELVEWMETRNQLLSELIQKVRKDQKQQNDATKWTMTLLEDLANIEAVARRGVHLLTAYALRARVAGATKIAEATNVTVSTAQNRGGSRLAQEVWNEVYPGPPSG